jgi:hypothetical protein
MNSAAGPRPGFLITFIAHFSVHQVTREIVHPARLLVVTCIQKYSGATSKVELLAAFSHRELFLGASQQLQQQPNHKRNVKTKTAIRGSTQW